MIGRMQLKANTRLLGLMFISLCLLYFVFSPSLNFLYYTGDDFKYTFGSPHKSCVALPGYHFMMTLGRPFQAYLDCLTFRYAYTQEQMRFVHILIVSLLAWSIALLADWLCVMGFSLINAFLTASLILMLPHVYQDAIIVGALSLMVPIFLTILSYRLFNQVEFNNFQKITIPLITLAAIFLLLALLSYPATAFFFPTLILIKLLFSDLKNFKKTRSEMIAEVIFFVCACIIYFTWAYYNMRYHPRAPVPLQYHLDHPNFGISELLTRLSLIGNVFDPIWQILPSTPHSYISKGIIVMLTFGMSINIIGYLFSQFYQQQKQLALSNLLQAILFGIGLFILGSGFFLVIPRPELHTRLCLGSITAGVAILVWCLHALSRVAPLTWQARCKTGILIIGFLIAAYQANLSLMKPIFQFVEYYNIVKTAIAEEYDKSKKLQRVHFVIAKDEIPDTRFTLANGALVRVLGRNHYQLTWCSSPDKLGNVNTIACLKKLLPGEVAITYSFVGEPFIKTKNMAYIEKRFATVNVDDLVATG